MAKNGTGLMVSNFNDQSYTPTYSSYSGLAPIESPIRIYKTTEEAIQTELYGKKPFVDPEAIHHNTLHFMEQSNQAVGRLFSHPFRTLAQFTGQIVSGVIDYAKSSIETVWEYMPTLSLPIALAQEPIPQRDDPDKRMEHLLYNKIGIPVSDMIHDKIQSETEEGNQLSKKANGFNKNVVDGLIKRIKTSETKNPTENAYVIDCLEEIDEILIYIPYFTKNDEGIKEFQASNRNRISIHLGDTDGEGHAINAIVKICMEQEKTKNTRCIRDLGSLEEETVECLENNCHWVNRLQIEKISNYFENKDITSTIENIIEELPSHLKGKKITIFSTYRGKTLANRWEISRDKDKTEPTGIVNATDGRWREATKKELNEIKLALTLREQREKDKPLITLPSHILDEVCNQGYVKKYKDKKETEKSIGRDIN